VAVNDVILNSLIRERRDIIRLQVVFASIVVSVGIIVIISGFASAAWASAEPLRAIFSLGGAFISTLSAFPISQMLTIRGQVALLVLMQAERSRLLSMTTAVDPKEIELLNQLFLQALGKAVAP